MLLVFGRLEHRVSTHVRLLAVQRLRRWRAPVTIQLVLLAVELDSLIATLHRLLVDHLVREHALPRLSIHGRHIRAILLES